MSDPVVLFVCLPLEGHLRPVVNVAATLQRLGGVAVEFAGMEQSRRAVEGAGVAFVSLGALGAGEAAPTMPMFETCRPQLPVHRYFDMAAGYFTAWQELMFPRLRAHLERAGAARYRAVVSDQATKAAHDAAAEARLPLAMLHQLPLSYSLALTGNNAYNMPPAVPAELPRCLLPEDMTWLQATLLNPWLKRRGAAALTRAYARHRAAARERLGLPPLGPSAPFEPPPGVPRALHVVGGTMELETGRPLPPGWHMSGPQGLPADMAAAAVDAGKDPQVAAFLAAARAAGEPVVYVALGSLVVPHAALVRAMAAAFEAVPGVRFLWALRQASHQFLPPGLSSGGDGRVLVVGWAPQTAVLAHPAVRLFVTHGGLGSLYEGLAAGCGPLVALPFFADQPVNAQHLANKRLGAAVDAAPGTLTTLPARLAAAITALLADGGTAARVAELGQRLRAGRGAEVAAALVREFALAADA